MPEPTMTDTTDRLALPMLHPGQAQKEMFHNEALALLDLATQAVVEAVGIDAPPAEAAPGRAWIVGSAPAGDWIGHAGALAGWTAGGWRFVAPFEGAVAWSRADGCAARCDGKGWTIGEAPVRHLVVGGVPVVGPQQAAIAAPAGGITVDDQARAALNAILAALRAHGLIATGV